MDCDQQPPPVEGVGKHATHDAEQHVGQHVGGLDERDEDRGVGGVHEQPLGANGLHPGAEVADEGGEPEPSEDREAKRSPG